jgi:hypothetical protein
MVRKRVILLIGLAVALSLGKSNEYYGVRKFKDLLTFVCIGTDISFDTN